MGSNGGCIFQVTCNNQKLEVVYKVQDSAILTLALNKAFCATGSKNGILHIWPEYFSLFLIEGNMILVYAKWIFHMMLWIFYAGP